MKRVVFMGTPAFAAGILRALVDSSFVQVVGVVTNPDQPVGRKRVITPNDVTLLARAHQLPIIQPERLRGSLEVLEQMRAWNPDFVVVASYGHIIPQVILDVAPGRFLNVHASLLPELRGASPIHSAILRGFQATGVTIMRMDAGMDTGDMLTRKFIDIFPRDTYTTLHNRLLEIGAPLLLDTLERFDSLTSQPQDESAASYTPIISKEDGRISWALPTVEIDRQIRAYCEWPTSFTTLSQGKRVTLVEAEPVQGEEVDIGKAPGTLVFFHDEPFVICGDGHRLRLRSVKVEGKAVISGAEFVRGYRQFDGSLLG